jgi:hypothetical protein
MAALAVFLKPLLASAQGNLIANGSFEDNGGSLNGWTELTPYADDYITAANGLFGQPITNLPDGSYCAAFLKGGAA